MNLNYSTIMATIRHLEEKERRVQDQLDIFRKNAAILIEKDDPSWLDWKPSQYDLNHRLITIRNLRYKLIYTSHRA